MTRRDKSELGKFTQQTADYSRMTCKCGHSFLFRPSTPFKYCRICGRKVKNNTKGRFLYKLYELLNKGSDKNDTIKL